MIIGVTHDQDGRVVQRLSVSTKVSIGLPPNGDRNHPTKLDHFVFLRKTKSANRVEWEADPELTRHYGEQCRELHIMLIDDDIENVFPSSYAWWTAIERKCWGDGITATRRTAEKPGGQPWPQCGNGCPELAAGQCKPSGDLRFVLADFPRLGSVCRIHTCSYRSIRQIHSALEEIQTFTGGRLAGITAKLTVRPEEATYFDRKEKRKKTAPIWALSLGACPRIELNGLGARVEASAAARNWGKAGVIHSLRPARPRVAAHFAICRHFSLCAYPQQTRYIFKILWVAHTNAHSAFTFSNPRNENRRNPRASLICPNTGSTIPLRAA